ncbi:putative enoyl-CoA hydratase 1 [Rhodococcus sp. RD6.2]|uniref:MaoC family dehydratase n=1 Tax=Rhodococcus sp. RD6.2 TaxID=260936 RepID=UPI00063B78CA|nr:MaoC family dehydratase [Rhodococcus sp. RD6.2]CRK51367.1 putative enoyl-CoA hydratase 1 [Rhodococcus sp. RD6.2]
MTTTFDSLDALDAALGEPLGPGEWLTVEQDRIDAFADTTGDHQWIHVDPELAASGPYGAPIAHGYLTLSLLPILGGGLYTIGTGSARVNYGSNKVRFPSPVRVGSRIRATATPVALDRKDSGAFLTTKFVVEIEGSDKPACVAEVVTLIVP